MQRDDEDSRQPETKSWSGVMRSPPKISRGTRRIAIWISRL